MQAARPEAFYPRPSPGGCRRGAAGSTGPVSALAAALDPPDSSAYPGGLNDGDSSIRCSSFYIRYRDEGRIIGEGGQFDLELPTPTDFLFDPCILQFELLFQKPAKANNLSSSSMSTPRLGPKGMGLVATQMFRFHPSAQGARGQCRLTFDELHACTVEAYAHVCLVCYTAVPLEEVPRRYTPPLPPPPPAKQRKRSGTQEAFRGGEEQEEADVFGAAGGGSKETSQALPLPPDCRGDPVPPLTARLGTWQPDTPTAAGQPATHPGATGAGPAGGPGAREGGGRGDSDGLDRFLGLTEVTADFLHQCLATLTATDQELCSHLQHVMQECEGAGVRASLAPLSQLLAHTPSRVELLSQAASLAARVDPGCQAPRGLALIHALAPSFWLLSSQVPLPAPRPSHPPGAVTCHPPCPSSLRPVPLLLWAAGPPPHL